jgi:YVTN family beta-propeller protein
MRFMWKAGVAAILLVVFISVGCGDAYRPIANPIIQPGGDPQNTDTVYAMNQNPAGLGSLSQFNVPGDAVIGNRSVSTDPRFIAFDVSGSVVYTANFASDNLSGNFPGGNSVITISLQQNSKPVALNSNRNGVFLVANQGHSPDTTCPSTGTIGVVDVTNSVLLASACVGPAPRFVLDAGAGNQKAFVLDDSDNVVRVVDLNSNATAGNQPTVGNNPVWAALSADGTQVYVVNQGSNTLSVINIASQTVVATVPTGTGPAFVTVDRILNRVYVSNRSDNTVSIYDAAQTPMSLLRTVNVGNSPQAIAVLRDGTRAYVANTGSPFITEIKSQGFQTSNINVVDTTAVTGATVTWVARSATGTKVYASFVEPTDLQNGTAVIATSNDSLLLTLAAPPRDIPECDQNPSTCPKERQRPMMLAQRF